MKQNNEKGYFLYFILIIIYMCFIIFPTQLYYEMPYFNTKETIYLIEEPRYFTDFDFHKLKIAYHRASM